MPDDEPDDVPEKSPGGSNIYRYDDENVVDPELEISPGDPELIEAVERHLDETFGDDAGRSVFHEIISPTVHLDVHVVPPGDVIDAWVLVTSGMAERPMSPPPEVLKGGNDCRWAELVTILPPDWPLFADAKTLRFTGGEGGPPDEHYWPLGWMKFLARFPHEYGAWFWHGHTIPNGPESEPFPGTRFVGSLLGPPVGLPESFQTMQVGDRPVEMLAVWPLYPEEMDLKLEKGTEALVERFEEMGITPLVDPSRPSAVEPKEKRKRWFGLF